MRKLLGIAAAVAAVLASSTGAEARVTGDPVRTADGLVEGVWAANANVKAYLGLPYAAAPVGDLRWRDPQPVVKWNGVRKADTLPPMCMQSARAPGSVSFEAYGNKDLPMSEDCLYLNMWVPANVAPGTKLPVFFWMHGGGYSTGTGSKPEFNGETLAQKGIIVIATNYRLNIFGFFAHPALSAESPHKSSGNYGLLDQVAALKWVQQNISAFGGDPSQVLIAGQSAGAGSVTTLMASPMARGLFTRASPQSGGSPGNAPTLQVGESNGSRFAAMIGNQSIAQLRAISAPTLLSLHADLRIPASPITDGYFLPKSVAEVWAAGEQAPVPFMPGWSAAESMEQTYDRTLTEFRRLAALRVGQANVAALEALYGVKDDESATTIGRLGLGRDAGAGRGTWRNARVQSPKAPTYLYYWAPNIPYWAGQSYAENSPASLLGAYHGSQVPYLFGNLQLLDREFQPIDRQLSDQWHRYLINFARTGDPNGPGLPAWGRYAPGSEVALTMGDRTATGPVPNRDKMEFFDKIVPVGAPRVDTGRQSMVSGR